MDNTFNDDLFGAESEMSSATVDWGKAGDFIVGTFVKSRHDVETQFGKNSIYELSADRGQFHKLTKKVAAEKPTIIGKGEAYNIWGRNDIFNGQMNALRPGQIVKIEFVAENEGKNGTWKDVKIFAPKDNTGKPLMNQEWVEANNAVAPGM